MAVKNINDVVLNEKNIQAPFQYLIDDDNFELIEVQDKFMLSAEHKQVKYRDGQNYFIVDVGYSIDGSIYECDILIDNVKIYPVIVSNIWEIKDAEVNENNFVYVKDDNNFRSCLVFRSNDLNKELKYKIYSYASSFSSWMFDEIARKLNTLDIDYPVKNFYEDEEYKINDIIKYNGYLYRVLKDFKNKAKNDDLLKTNTMIITPFKRLENGNKYKLFDILEKNNQYFVVQNPFIYNEDAQNLNNNLSPLTNIIDWQESINILYKNTIIIKDNRIYLVINDVLKPVWDNVYNNQIIDFLKANQIPTDNKKEDGSEETVQEAVNRIDERIDTEITDRTEADTALQNNIDDEKNKREIEDNILNEKKQDKIQSGIDNYLHNKSYNILDTELNIDKTNPLIMEGDTADISIITNGTIKINLEANNLGYELNNNILTIKKIKPTSEEPPTEEPTEEIDYSGILIITASKETDLENIYRDNTITIYINSNTLYTDLSVDNDILDIEPNTTKDLIINTNADTENIKYSINNNVYEITKTDKTLSIKNTIEKEEGAETTQNDKPPAILTITAKADDTENTDYAESSINVYINSAEETKRDLLTLDIISDINASANSIIKRDNQGQAFAKNDTLTDDTLINNKTLTQNINNNKTELQNNIDKKQDLLTAGTNITIEKQEDKTIISANALDSAGIAQITDDGEEYLIPYKTFNGKKVYGTTQIFNVPTVSNKDTAYKVKHYENMETILYADCYIRNTNGNLGYYKGYFRNWNNADNTDKLLYWINSTGLHIIMAYINSHRKIVLTVEYTKKE